MTDHDYAGFGLADRTIALLEPPPDIRTWDWVKENARTPEGKPFNHIDYPWTEGICDEWDNPRRQLLWLQFSARCGKTLIAQCLMISSIARRPAPALYGSSTETLVKQTMLKKLYPMFEHCDETADWLPPPHRRLQTRADLKHSTLYTAWSGSPTTLADLDPHYLHGGEIDKWDKAVSDEADPLALFLERGREVPDRKAILESTPTVARKSRVERGLVNGTDCRWHVPCPRCRTYQEMVYCDYDRQKKVLKYDRERGGLIYDLENGEPSEAKAYTTARYVCCSCRHEWADEDRRPAIRQGIWVPRGQWVGHGQSGPELRGTAVNGHGPDASFQLSRLYAPTFTLGDNAREIAACASDEDRWRNFLNSWAGLTYEARKTDEEWHEVAERLCTASPVGLCPEGAIFCTAGIDVQKDHFVFVVAAWRQNTSGHVVHYGTVDTWEDVSRLLDGTYAHVDGGPELPIRLSLVDCRDGNRTEEVSHECRKLHRVDRIVWPSMGSNAGLMKGASFQRSVSSEGGRKAKAKSKRRGATEFSYITVNTTYWQSWVHNALFFREPGASGSITVHSGGKSDQDLWDQLMNEMPEGKVDTTGHSAMRYVVVREHQAWDLRDAMRYARCAAEVWTNGAWDRQRDRKPPTPSPEPAAIQERQQQPPRQPRTQESNSWLKRRTGWLR